MALSGTPSGSLRIRPRGGWRVVALSLALAAFGGNRLADTVTSVSLGPDGPLPQELPTRPFPLPGQGAAPHELGANAGLEASNSPKIGSAAAGPPTLGDATLVSNHFLQVGEVADGRGGQTLTNGSDPTITNVAAGFDGWSNSPSVPVDRLSSQWTARNFSEAGANGSTDAMHQPYVLYRAAVTGERHLVSGSISGSPTGTCQLSILSGGQVTRGPSLASPSATAPGVRPLPSSTTITYYTESPAAGTPGPDETGPNGQSYGTVYYYGYTSAFLDSAPPTLTITTPSVRAYADPSAGGFTQQGFDLGTSISQYAHGVPPEEEDVYTLLSSNTYFAPAPAAGDTVTFGYLGPNGPRPPGPPTHPNLPAGQDAYTFALGGNTFAETDAGFFNAPADSGITFTLGGTYTSTNTAKLEGQMITLTGSGTFTTPILLVAGNVNVIGGTIHGDQFFVDDASNTAATTTTLTLSGASAKLEAPTFLSIGFATTGASTLAMKNGASGTAGSIYLGTGGAGSMGVLTLDNATLVSTGFLQVGDAADSQGTVTLTNGGALTTTNAAIGFGGGANASSVSVDGASSMWTAKGYIEVGANGSTDATHQLIVRNGGAVTSQGYLVVGGVSGNSTGTGRLSILSGGKVTSGTTLPSPSLAAAVGFGDNSTGSVTIDGAGSTWDIKQRLNVGYGNGSSGLVTVQNGGTLQVEGDTVRLGRVSGSTGTLTFDKAGGGNPVFTFGGDANSLLIGDEGTGNFNVQGGAQITNSTTVVIGNQDGAVGNAAVKGSQSSWTINDDLTIGSSGTGTLTVQDGDTLTIKGYAVLAQNAGSTGTLILDGVGSQLHFTGSQTQAQIGGSGNATLKVLNGASANLSDVYLGASSSGSGTITVDSTDAASGRSTVSVTGTLDVGVIAPGTSGSGGQPGGSLNVTGGGLVTVSGPLNIGDDANATGVAHISGIGSELRAGALEVGVDGNGQLTLDTSASATVAGNMYIGYGTPASGSSPASVVNVNGVGTGTQTKLTVSGNLLVGYNGPGALNVSAGAQLMTTGSVGIGVNTGAVGTVTLTGANTNWTLSATGLAVGQDGTGTLTIQTGATVTGSPVSLGTGSGTGTVTVTGGGSKLDLSGGYLNIGQSSSATSATVNVQSGGELDAGTVTMRGGSDTLTVNGVDTASNHASTFHADQLNILSTSGTSNIAVSGGGRLQVDNGTISLISATSSQLSVRDQGSVLSASSVGLQVGLGGSTTATVNFLSGATVDTADTTIIGANATAMVSGSQAAPTVWTIHPQTTTALSLQSGGQLTLSDGGQVNVMGQTLVGSGSTLSVGGMAATFTTAGLEVDGTLTVGANGQVTSSANSPLGDAITVQGRVQMNGAGASLGGSSLYIYGGSSFTASAGTANIGGRTTVAGGGTLDLSGGGSLNVGLVLNQAAAGQISVGAGGSVKNFGNVYASQVNIGLGGTVGGSGSFHGAVVNGGKVAPGDPQTLTINGNYTQTSDGTLDIAIAGADPSQMDRLVVTGTASVLMGAALELDFIAGFAPKQGAIFDFLAAGSLDANNRTFGSVDITGLAPGFQYNVQPDPNNPGSYELIALNNGVSTTVPEPGTAALLGLGAGGLLFVLGRRTRRMAA